MVAMLRFAVESLSVGSSERTGSGDGARMVRVFAGSSPRWASASCARDAPDADWMISPRRSLAVDFTTIRRPSTMVASSLPVRTSSSAADSLAGDWRRIFTPAAAACEVSAGPRRCDAAPTRPTSKVSELPPNTFGSTITAARITTVTAVEIRKDRSLVRSTSSRRAVRRMPSTVFMPPTASRNSSASDGSAELKCPAARTPRRPAHHSPGGPSGRSTPTR
jgi:hypothetical protein